MSLERNASRLGAVMMMEGSWFQAIIVRGRMKQNQRNEGETMADDDDDWLQAEIQRELDAIDSADLDLCEKADDIPVEDEMYGEDDVTSEDEPMPASILDYLTKVKVQSEKLQQELEDCDTLIEGTSACYHRKQFEFDEDLQHLAMEEGIDIHELKERVIVGLDKEDVDDEKLAATYVGNNLDDASEKHYKYDTNEDRCMVSVQATSGHVSPVEAESAAEPTQINDVNLNETETAISKKDKITESTADQKPEVNNCQTSFRAENTDSSRVEHSECVRADNENADSIEGTISEVVTDDSASNHGSEIPVEVKSQVIDQAGILENNAEEVTSLLPDQGAVVLVTDSDILERQLLLQVTEWDQRRRTNDKLREQQLTSRRLEEEGRTKEMVESREQKRQETLEEERRLTLKREKTEAEEMKNVEEIEKKREEIQESFTLQQRQMDQLIEETRAERNELQQSVKERCIMQEQKKESAATKIQATFRRFRARLLYGAAVEEKIEEVRATMEAEKVRKVALQIEARNIEHQRKKTRELEERKQLERTKQEEAQAKQEIEKKKKEERERKKREEKEKWKQEEEEKQKAEEENKLMEKQRKEREKQMKLEEVKRKREEEKKKKEEEKMRKEAVACRMREEEARRQDERRKEEEARLEEQQENGEAQHMGVCDGEQQNKHEMIKEEGHKLEAGGEEKELLRKDETETQEKLKNKVEDKTKKLNKERLISSEGEVEILEETLNETEQDLRKGNRNGNKNEEKLREDDEEDKIQMAERNSEVDCEINLDRKQSSQPEQVFEQSPKVAQDFEQPPEVVHDSVQSTQTTKKIEQSSKTMQGIEQSGKTVLDIEQSGKTVQDIKQLAKMVPGIDQSQSDIITPDIEQGNIKPNIIYDDSIGADNAKVSNKTSDKVDSSCALSATRDWGAYLPEHIDNQRITWIRDCLSWSKITSALKMRPRRGSSKKPPRRPASANALPSLTEVRLLSATGTTSLQKITTVQLQDLPGCSLSTLSQCCHLKALALTNCSLVTLEGLEGCPELSYLDLRDNSIEMIAPLEVNDKLMFLNLSYNCLSMIHGLDGCTNIRYLDLSHNRITRIAGLSDMRRLHTLQLSHNQLISSRGIGDLVTLQNLDLSYNLLPRLDDLQQLALLQVLKANGNNLMHVPELSNHVLLQQMLLNDNSISSVRNISQGWCPLLRQLDLGRNSVSLLSDLSSCLLLETLDLTDNQISDLPNLTKALSTMRSLDSIKLTGCPVCQEAEYRMAVSQALPTLRTLDGTTVSSCQKHSSRTEFEEMCLSQGQQESSLRSSHDTGVEQCTSLADLSRVHRRYFDRSFQLAVNHRQCHEYGEVTIDPTTTFDLTTTETQPVVSQAADMKALFDEAVLKTSQAGSVVNVPRPPGGERPKQLVGRSQSHLLVEKTTVSKPTELSRIMLSREDKAATQIQALWRGHFLRCRIEYYTRMSAAMTIQACWRGYSLRKILHQAMDYAKLDDDDNDSIYGEVNMDDFNFSEADLDKGWTPPETPQLPQNHAVLRHPPGSESAPLTPVPAVPVVPHLFPRSPFPPGQPKQAWRNADSLFSQRGYQIGARTPLASHHSECGSTQRSCLSKKEEQLTEEWGFKDPRTAELMLQRAKKLKYNAVKRKKLRKLDPKQRLALMRRLEQPQVVQPPTRSVVPRTEYFKGRVTVDEMKSKKEFSDKRLRMFMWLHTQVGTFDDISSSRISKHHGRAESSQNLPLLTPGVIAGRKTQLMGSSNSLEMESLLDGPTRDVVSQPLAAQRHLSIQDDYARSRLPQIKTSSAPAIRIKEKMSWRNKGNTRTSGGWGGGRKRSKPD